jgi:hypothetical protein
MESSQQKLLSRRGFCLCCVGGAAFAASDGWLTPRQAFAEARAGRPDQGQCGRLPAAIEGA